MNIDLTLDLCAEVFLRHLDEPVGGDAGPCPLRFVMREVGLPDTMPFPRSWESDFIDVVDSYVDERYGDSSAWHKITGRIALDLLDKVMGEG